MRTAFCFSGELRSIDKTYDSLKNRLMNRFSNYDVFYHTWSDDPNIDKLSILENDSHTKDVLVEDRQTFHESDYNLNKRDEVNVQGMLRQLYCLKQSNMLKLKYEKYNDFTYDIVVRIRPDLFIVNNTSLEQSAEMWDMKKYLYTTDHDDHLGYNDRLYFSNSSNMDHLSNRLDYIQKYYDNGGIIHYESYFKHCVDHMRLKVCRSQMEFVLLRTDGEVSSELKNTKYYENHTNNRS